MAFNFNDFVMWYRAQSEQAERYKQDNISKLHSDPLSDLSSNMWSMRFAEAKKNYEKILTLTKNGTLSASSSEHILPDGTIRESFFISRLELQKYCCEYHIFPSFLLPFDPNIVPEQVVDELEHVVELKDKIKELEKRLGETEKNLNEYLCLEDENDPLFIKEVAVVIGNARYFRKHRQREQDSAKKRARLRTRNVYGHLRLNNTAVGRIAEVGNWEDKEVQ